MGRKPKFDNWALEDWIYSREDLTALEKHVALATFWHRNHRTGDCHPSVELIAKRAGLNKNTVSKYLKRIESRDVCTVERKPGRGGNWYYALFDDAERAEPFRNSKREPVIKCHQTEKEIEMPKTTEIDPALVDLVADIKHLGITKGQDIREEILAAIKKMDGGIARKLNDAGIPRLRGEGLWTHADVFQLRKSAKPAKPPPKSEPPQDKYMCPDCRYGDPMVGGQYWCQIYYCEGRKGVCPKFEQDSGGPF